MWNNKRIILHLRKYIALSFDDIVFIPREVALKNAKFRDVYFWSISPLGATCPVATNLHMTHSLSFEYDHHGRFL